MMTMIQQLQQQQQLMLAQLQTSHDTNTRLQTELQQLSQQNANLQQTTVAALQSLTVLPDLVKTLKEQMDKGGTKEKPQLVDNKGIGKPSVFNNEEDKFRSWAAKTESFMRGVLGEQWRKVFEWAVEQTNDLSVDGADAVWGELAEEEDSIPDFQNAVGQIHTALTQLTDGESFDIVVNAGAGNGLEAWRKLHRRFDPATGGRKRNLLRGIMNPGRCKFSELGAGLVKWEEMVKRYEARKNDKGVRETLSEDLKMSSLESLVPEDLEKHLLMNQSRLKTYELMREEIVAYVEARHGMKIQDARIQQTTNNAMDVDALAKGSWGKDGKGKSKGNKGGKDGKGKGKGVKEGKGQGKPSAKFEGECNNCGRYGHKAADCWRKVSETNKGGEGKTKGGKGKGKGKGRDTNALEDTTAAAEAPAAGAIDFGSLDVCGLCQDNCGVEWLKCNFDTGAAITAIPKQLAPDGGKPSEATYKTASGEMIHDYGSVAITGEDEHGQQRRLKGHATDVHKILISASAVHGKGFESWIGNGGGQIMPINHPVTQGLKREFERLCKLHGTEGFVPLYEERGVYNFYLRTSGKSSAVSLAPVDVGVSSSGNARRATQP